jgi:transglutaminase-like putative cysteine protease
MRIRAGFKITYQCSSPTPMTLLLSVRPERRHDLITPQIVAVDPACALAEYIDPFGNIAHRLLAPAGATTLSTDFLIRDSGLPDETCQRAIQHPVEQLPDEVLQYLHGSRYCETQLLTQKAWDLFGCATPGWSRVQAIVDYVHERIRFGYMFARPTRTAAEVQKEQHGVCRDFAHLAIAFCRCMNIPARYCTGYLGDIGIPPVPAPMDFSAWFEAYLDGRWHTFDARHNTPRIGRIPIAFGRDAADVALSTIFGPAALTHFEIITDEVVEGDYISAMLKSA